MGILANIFGRSSLLPLSKSNRDLSCCKKPVLGISGEAMGHADSMEFILNSCTSCGASWLNVFCEATAISGYERVSDEDAKLMLATTPGPERKEFMRAWSRSNIK